MNVQNSTEFNAAPTILVRGEEPLIVVDGVPYSNISLRDIASDDVESIDILKGATASALYGARGGSGVIMVTTKKGGEEGLDISVNSSTMFNAGYLAIPEAQHSYSSGTGGVACTTHTTSYGVTNWTSAEPLFNITPILISGKNNRWYPKERTTSATSWNKECRPTTTSA